MSEFSEGALNCHGRCSRMMSRRGKGRETRSQMRRHSSQISNGQTDGTSIHHSDDKGREESSDKSRTVVDSFNALTYYLYVGTGTGRSASHRHLQHSNLHHHHHLHRTRPCPLPCHVTSCHFRTLHGTFSSSHHVLAKVHVYPTRILLDI